MALARTRSVVDCRPDPYTGRRRRPGAGDGRRVMSAPGQRWFAEDRVIRRCTPTRRCSSVGLRALLLQSLHPLAMAGVAKHSDYRSDPWGRLQRTADFLAATTFGPARSPRSRIARVRHGAPPGAWALRPTAGRTRRATRTCCGGCTSARSTASSPRTAATAPADSTDAEADEYVADMAVVAIGARGEPSARVGARIFAPSSATSATSCRARPRRREAARFLLVEPPLPLAARPPYALLAVGGGGAAARAGPAGRCGCRTCRSARAVLVRPAGAAVTRLHPLVAHSCSRGRRRCLHERQVASALVATRFRDHRRWARGQHRSNPCSSPRRARSRSSNAMSSAAPPTCGTASRRRR